MSFISVPIKQGTAILKFPNIPRSKPEFLKNPESKATSKQQFLKELADQGKLIALEGQRLSAAGKGVVITFTPNNGTTFYLLSAVMSSSGAADLGMDKVIGGVTLNVNIKELSAAGSIDCTIEGYAFVGNGIDELRLVGGVDGRDYNANLSGYLDNKIATSSTRTIQ